MKQLLCSTWACLMLGCATVSQKPPATDPATAAIVRECSTQWETCKAECPPKPPWWVPNSHGNLLHGQCVLQCNAQADRFMQNSFGVSRLGLDAGLRFDRIAESDHCRPPDLADAPSKAGSE